MYFRLRQEMDVYNLNEYAAILQFIDSTEAERLALIVKKFPVKIIHEKNTGMIMMQTIDSFGNPFYTGEVLATSSEVEYKSVRGYGMLAGSDGNKSLVLAVIDASLQAKDEYVLGEIQPMMEEKKQEMERKTRHEKIFIESTKVQFGLMAEG